LLAIGLMIMTTYARTDSHVAASPTSAARRWSACQAPAMTATRSHDADTAPLTCVKKGEESAPKY